MNVRSVRYRVTWEIFVEMVKCEVDIERMEIFW